LNGYKGGEIVWQKSTDQNNWQDISGTNDTIFEVTVTDSLFYRAKVSEGTCKPYYSDTTEIIMLPQPTTADAGDNITDECVPVTLNGNSPSNGTGEWTVVSGSGGSFDDSTSASASFSGNPGDTYTLEWAIGTQCDTTTDQVEVSFIGVDFTADKTTITPGETVSFTDESTGNNTSWSWDFGDGATSSQKNPSHTYTSTGTYTVELTVSNDCGEDTETKTDYITVESNLTACDWNNDTTFTDSRDGQEYKQTKIGDQCWMAENLAYLPSVNMVGVGSEDNSSGKYYYVYGYDDTNVSEAKATENYDIYGVLYNWNAVMDGASSSSSNPSGVQGVCPDGWHVPSDEEWAELENYVSNDGHSGSVGTALKSTSGWDDNGNGTDDYGFSGLPVGSRGSYGYFNSIGQGGDWWSATVYSTDYAWYRSINYSNEAFSLNIFDKDYGFSVRCLRD
jgi:uncharacterized protein (TIGR02145 family)